MDTPCQSPAPVQACCEGQKQEGHSRGPRCMCVGSTIWVNCVEHSPTISIYTLWALPWVSPPGREGSGCDDVSSRLGSQWANKEEEAGGGRLARGGQEGKLGMSSSSVGVLCSAPLGLILVYTQIAPCIFVGQCVSAHVISLLCVNTL